MLQIPGKHIHTQMTTVQYHGSSEKPKFLPKILINGKGKRKTTITFTEFESIRTQFGQAKNTQPTERQRQRESGKQKGKNQEINK